MSISYIHTMITKRLDKTEIQRRLDMIWAGIEDDPNRAESPSSAYDKELIMEYSKGLQGQPVYEDVTARGWRNIPYESLQELSEILQLIDEYFNTGDSIHGKNNLIEFIRVITDAGNRVKRLKERPVNIERRNAIIIGGLTYEDMLKCLRIMWRAAAYALHLIEKGEDAYITWG